MTFSTDHEPDDDLCEQKHGEIPHDLWAEMGLALMEKGSQPEPWELYDFVLRANGHMPPEARLTADIRMQFDRDRGQESFELWSFYGDDPDHTVVADFGVNPMVGTDWPRLRFMLSALKIRPETPWSIAGPIAALARERKVPVG